jgi:hypothetical protein
VRSGNLEASLPCKGVRALVPGKADAGGCCQLVDDEEADVVTRRGVGRPGVAQADDEPALGQELLLRGSGGVGALVST